MRRSIAGAGAAAIGAATAVTALVLGTATGVAQPGTSSAFGVSAEGTLLNIDPTPYVESTDGSTQTSEVANVPLGEFGEVRLITLLAGDDTASVELAGVDLSGEPGSIEAEVIKVECEGDTGSVTIVGLTINDEEVPIPKPEPNQVIFPGDPLLNVTANKQTTNPDGTFTVEGLVLFSETLDQEIVLGSATCGGPADDDKKPEDPDNGDGDNGDNGDGPTATKPAPITTGLPVTG
ncbi:MAG: choice-of-anchor P family protein [Haloechinothrix sp.]